MKTLLVIISIICNLAIIVNWISAIKERIKNPGIRYRHGFYWFGPIGSAFFTMLLIDALGGTLYWTVFYLKELFAGGLTSEEAIVEGIAIFFLDAYFWGSVIIAVIKTNKEKKR